MKKTIQLIAVVLIIMATACQRTDFDEIMRRQETQQEQLNDLEARVKGINTSIEAMQKVIKALEGKDYVTGVKPLEDGTGYVITFEKSGDVTIKHGAKGDKGEKGGTPLMGVKMDEDEKYYWTVDGEFLLDDGNKIPVTGEDGHPGEDAIAPQLRINEDTNEWEVSTDGGEEWIPLGVKAIGEKGDSMFSAIYVENPDFVELTLADGTTKIRLPRHGDIFVAFDSYDPFYCSEEENEIVLTLPSGLKESDFMALMATITSSKGSATDIATRGASATAWNVSVVKPAFENGAVVDGSAKVYITLPEIKTDYKALLKVTLVDTKGVEHSASRIVWYQADENVDNTTGNLSDKITNPASVKELSIIGTLSEADFKFIRDNMTALEVLDLSRVTLTELPTRAMAFYTQQGYNGNKTLHTVILPETLQKTGWAAFGNCNRLTHVTFPDALTEITAWTFEMCHGLTSVTIPAHIKTVGDGIFSSCEGLTTARIDTDLPEIPKMMFAYCTKLTTVNLPKNITRIGDDAFCICPLEGKLTIPSKVEVIGQRAFSYAEITAVTFPEGLREIHPAAFNVSGLTTVVLPASLEKMGDGAFQWYRSGESPTSITFLGATPPQVIYNTDYYGDLLKPDVNQMWHCMIYVPASAVDTYKTSVWGTGTDAYDKPDSYPKGCKYFNPDNIQAIP